MKMRETSRGQDKKLGDNNKQDSSVYDAMVNLAQNFNLRYPLVDGKGNFGSLDRDPSAAQRYTECRLSRVGDIMLKDVDKNTVPMKLNYDETEYEPEVLPTLFPALLANPTTGIAVGLTSSFLPHNVKDVYQAIDVIFKNLLEEKETSIDEVINIIKAPDFPTGGEILGYADAIKAYKEGHGKVILRGKYHIEDKKNKILIVFDEIPWGICKKNTVTKIVELSKEKLADVTEIRDESNMDGVRIVIECKKTANVDWIIKNIFKYTDMQSNVSMRHVALQDGKPKVNLTLLELLEAFIEHAIEVIQNRCQYDYKYYAYS